MNPQKEYEQYLAILEATSLGQAILVSLEKMGESLSSSLLGECKGEGTLFQSAQSTLVKTVSSFLGKKKVAQLIEQNATLFCGRLMMALRGFDEKSLDTKVELVVDLLIEMLQELEAVSDRTKLMQESPHDKRARKQRRQAILAGDHAFFETLERAEEAFVDRSIQMLIPEGSKSLILPAGAGLFAGTIEESLKEIKPFAMRLLKQMLSKERKIDLLCRGYAYIYIWGCKGCPMSSCAQLEVSDAPAGKLTPHVERAIEELFPILTTYAHYLPKEVIARRAILLLYGLLEQFSAEQTVLHLVQRLVNSESAVAPIMRTNEELDSVITKLCSDEKIPNELLKKYLLPTHKEEDTKEQKQTILEGVLQGIRSSMSQKTTEVLLRSIPWQEVFYHLLEEIRLFVLSIHFDKAMVDGLSTMVSKSP